MCRVVDPAKGSCPINTPTGVPRTSCRVSASAGRATPNRCSLCPALPNTSTGEICCGEGLLVATTIEATSAAPACAKARLARLRWPEKRTERDIGVRVNGSKRISPATRATSKFIRIMATTSISNSGMAALRNVVDEMNQKRLKAGPIVNVV